MWARKYKVKLAGGTDFLFSPANNKKQNADILKLKEWMAPAEILKLVKYDNAQLLALSGPRNPYPGKLELLKSRLSRICCWSTATQSAISTWLPIRRRTFLWS